MAQKHVKRRQEQVEQHHEVELAVLRQHGANVWKVRMPVDQVGQCPCLPDTPAVQPEIASLASLTFYNTQAVPQLELYLYNPLSPNPFRHLRLLAPSHLCFRRQHHYHHCHIQK